jgi:nucleoid-associated protein YgaU
VRMKFGAALVAGILVAGCGVGSVPPKDSGSVGVLETPASTYSTPAYSTPVPTETTTPVATTSEAPAVTTAPPAAKAAAPRTTVAKPKSTAQAAPEPAGCGADYYRNSDGNCVHRPGDNPSGATAQCKDGSYSYSQHRSGTCSGHGGVKTWL